MNDWVRLVGPNNALELFGIRLVGVNAENAMKLVFSVALIVLVTLISRLATRLVNRWLRHRAEQIRFWARQTVRVVAALVIVIGVVSIWFDDPTRLATGIGLVSAGLAFALQRVVTAIAGYVVILRGKTFNVGDRITLGGVRGDVIALNFIYTTIMEMGQPPSVQNADPAQWVKSRQYTGRIVTVSNDKIFDEPVYNYTREFPYIWEEIVLPIAYNADRAKAEEILLEAAMARSEDFSRLAQDDLAEIERRYFIRRTNLRPKVYWRLTDNWLELTVRFLTTTHEVRDVKDAMSRQILSALDEANISIASATFEITGLPSLKLRRDRD